MKSLPRLSILLCSVLTALAAAHDARQAPADPAVVLYAAHWCGYCAKARSYLAQNGIAYREIDIDDAAGRAAYERAGAGDGGRGIPLLVAEGRQVRGFSAATYDRLFSGRR